MAVALANTQTYENTGTGSTQTQTGYTPAAGSNRILVVRIHGLRTSESGAFTVDTVTFGGVSMTQAVTVSTTSSSRTYRTAIWYLINPSGSSGDVVATFSHASNSTIIATATLTGAAQTSPVISTDSDYNDGTISYLTLQLTGTIPSGSIGIYAATTHCNNNPTFSWTSPFTEEYDIRTASNTSTEVAGSGGWRDTYLYSKVLPEPTQAWPKCGAAVGFLPAAAAQTITATSITTAESVGGMTATPGAVSVTPSGIATAQSVPGPVASAGPVTILPTAIVSAASIGAAVVTPGVVSVTPSSIATGQSIGTATVSTALAIAPSGVATAESLSTPTVTPGAAAVLPSAIVTAESVGVATAGVGAVTVMPSAIASLESVALPVIGAGGIIAGSIVTDETFGTAALTTGGVNITPTSVSSDENVNGVTLALGAGGIVPGSIETAESVPEPVLADHRWIGTMNVGADDATEDASGLMSLYTTSGNVNATSPYAAFIVRNLPIPAGATIIHAYLRLYMFGYDDPGLTVAAQASHSPAALAATTSDISARALTDATVSWVASNIGLNKYNVSPDLAAVLQEVVNLPGWTENVSDALFVLHDNGTGGHIRFNMADAGIDPPQLVVDYYLGDTVQTITVTGIGSGESVAEATVTPGVTTVDMVNGVESLEAVGEPNLINPQTLTDAGEIATGFFATGGVVSQGGPVVVVDDGIATEETVGDDAVFTSPSYVVISDGIETLESWGAVAVDIGAITISPDGIATLESIGAALLSTWAEILPSGVASGEAVGVLTVGAGVVDIAADSIGSAESLGAAAVSAGEWFILVDSVTTAESIGTLVIAPGGVTILPDGVASLGSIGDAALTTVVGLAPASIGGEESVNVPEIIPGAATLAPDGVASLEAWGAADLSAVVYIVPVGLASAESLGALTLIPGAIVVAPDGVTTLESVGQPGLQFGGVSILPSGMATAAAFGTAVLIVGPTTVTPIAIASLESFGLLLLMSRFLPTVNIRRVPFKARVYESTGKDRVYDAPDKARVYVVEE